MENPVNAQFRSPAEARVMNAAALQVPRLKRWLIAVLSALALFSLAMGAPAIAHEKKKHAPVAQAQQQGSSGPNTSEAIQNGATAMHSPGSEMMDGMDMGMDRSKMSFFERLFDWFGRLHPMVVHFPIAFFPAALIPPSPVEGGLLLPPLFNFWSSLAVSLCRSRPQLDGSPG